MFTCPFFDAGNFLMGMQLGVFLPYIEFLLLAASENLGMGF